ncbi:uncharacterized protein LOC114304574 [Camellia sinensis]|uniref:uncharacterized protein LOC114304574 n=1 Tax=Camellia sinensis TaxID=4442 RepID=UPI0010363BAC|nr:uncharacterized protein LOC114304574 [Camellia sinensis]
MGENRRPTRKNRDGPSKSGRGGRNEWEGAGAAGDNRRWARPDRRGGKAGAANRGEARKPGGGGQTVGGGAGGQEKPWGETTAAPRRTKNTGDEEGRGKGDKGQRGGTVWGVISANRGRTAASP